MCICACGTLRTSANAAQCLRGEGCCACSAYRSMQKLAGGSLRCSCLLRQLLAQLPALRASLQRAAAALLVHAFLREAGPRASPSATTAAPEWAAVDARSPAQRGEALLAAVVSASGGGEGSEVGSGLGPGAAAEEGALLRALGGRWRVSEALAAALASVSLTHASLTCRHKHTRGTWVACTLCHLAIGTLTFSVLL